MKVIWDMETGDPDDFLTLLLLLGHPQVDLKAVTITPGSPEQVGLVRQALSWFDQDIPVGAYSPGYEKQCVSKWHYNAYGKIPPSFDVESGPEILLEHCNEDTTLVTGGPLKNLGKAIELGESLGQPFKVRHLVSQGGVAGEGVVPPEDQLEKFKGLITCPTYNLNGDPKSALRVLAHDGFRTRHFVSKNICHGLVYDRRMHKLMGKVKDKGLSLSLIWKGMDFYLSRKPGGKKFHDPLAACCAIDRDIGTWAEVELYREKGKWGSKLSPGSGTWIIVDYDHSRFMDTLMAYQ